jgi:hypothetical protein
VEVRPYDAADAAAWDDLVARSANGTLLHTRRYLGYHGDRFADRSLVVLDGGRPAAVLPAALDPSDPACVVSHPGLTYGGLVHPPSFRGTAVRAALDAALAHWSAARVVYKPVPHVFHRAAAQDDLWALFVLGAKRFRVDLSWAVDLTGPPAWTGNRRRAAAKAAAAVDVTRDDDAVEELWAVLTESLAERHGVRPVHTAAELAELLERCPGEIAVHVARRDSAVVAGAVVYVAGAAWHTQYLTSGAAGREVGALDAVVAYGIDAAREAGARWYDFGISNEDAGRTLNEGLYFYKSSFGGGSVVHEQYEL